jgi:hypothetical protein
MHVLAMLLCTMNIVTRIVVAAILAERAVLYVAAAAACGVDGKDARSDSDKQKPLNNLSNVFENSVAVTKVLEAAVLVLTVGAFLLFFPACIVMFRRVERRLDAIMQEMNLRSDIGTVFLPYEFSPAAADGARRQVEMQVVEARAFLGRLKSAAAAQAMRFVLCLLLLVLALVARMSLAVFISTFFVNLNRSVSCSHCGSCQDVEGVMRLWFSHSPLMVPLVYSTCSTLPLLFSLWLMITKHDRELMLHPDRFRADRTSLQHVDGEMELRLNAERLRMGVDLT